MARKQKRKTRPRRPPPAAAAPAPRAAPRSESVGAAVATVQAVEMRLGAPVAGKRRSGRVVLESTDPAIPLDQVPHFTGDLKRIGLTMLAMVVVLVGGSFLIPLAVH